MMNPAVDLPDYDFHGTMVPPGERMMRRLSVARLPTGQDFDLPVHVLHGVRPGPTMFVSAALHGDELGGIAAIRELLDVLDPKTMGGTLLAVPVINGFGVINGSRYLPDRRDLNRSFPGSKRGSLTGQLANLFLQKVVAQCEFGVDLHCGSAGRANLPQIRCDLDTPRTRELALAFAGPLVLHSKLRPGSLRGAASKVGTIVLLHEAGEAHRLNRRPVRQAVEGLLRLMSAQGLWAGAAPQHEGKSYLSRKSWWLRANRSGLCEVHREWGEHVKKGEPVARIYDPSSMSQSVVRAKRDGMVIGVQRQAVVYRGDALAHLATVEACEPA